ncbi:MAG: hypothetical protein Kow0090_05730 [Myxococcota bacterium]
MAEFVLQFISGKYRGGEFPLEPTKEVLIGRSSDLDMVLVEDMVSRKHARITYENGDFYIHDLGSTNGTFVNGERIKKKKIQEGDRILVGTSILKFTVKGKDGDKEAKPPVKPPPVPIPEEKKKAAGASPPPLPRVEKDSHGLGGIEIEEEIEESLDIPPPPPNEIEGTERDEMESSRLETGDSVELPPQAEKGKEEDFLGMLGEDDDIEIEPVGEKGKRREAKDEALFSLDSNELESAVASPKPGEESEIRKAPKGEPKLAPPEEAGELKFKERFKNRGKPTMTGEIEEIHVPDLMQLFTVSKKTGTCYIDREKETAKIYFREGHIYFVELDSSPGLSPLKAALRIMTWDTGTFSMCAEKPITVENSITANTNSLLMEAMAQKDEIDRHKKKIPDFDMRINLVLPPKTPFRKLKPEALDALEYVLQAVTVRDVMDKHRGSDRDAIEGLASLMDAGIIELERE